MAKISILDDHIMNQIKEVSEYIDHSTYDRIINKLTDYAEILTEKKISGIVNYNYDLNSSQIEDVISLLYNIQAISKIYVIALTGSKDLESEYISNVFSATDNTDNNSSYINVRNIIENRLTHQIQQYNMNMTKKNTTLPMHVNELRSHIKSYHDILDTDMSISPKVQHGCIAASLHDVYITIINHPSWWNDLTYLKYFSNEDDTEKRKYLLASKKPKLFLGDINDSIKEVSNRISELNLINSISDNDVMDEPEIKEVEPPKKKEPIIHEDKLLMTPFGKQYGSKIDLVITKIFDPEKINNSNIPDNEILKAKIIPMYDSYTKTPSSLSSSEYKNDIINFVDYLIVKNYTVKSFANKFIYSNKNEPFERFFSDTNKNTIENFIMELHAIYFNKMFSSLFRIVKSQDMRKHACAYIIKRIYLSQGEELTVFGSYLIRTIAKIGKIKI
ncbi:hypothetical protein ACFL20_08785 [Spirochaetota bacterium]